MLARVDPTRPAGVVRRLYSSLAATRVALFISRHINWKLDPLLLRVTGGRFCSTLFIRSALLETAGARTGQPRKNVVIYFHDGDGLVLVASNGGSPGHPSWYFNAMAHPDVRFGGVPMHATVVDDESERERLWVLADNVFPAYASYRRRAGTAGRTIPIMRLTPTRSG